MKPISDLSQLLRSMAPTLRPETYAFALVPNLAALDPALVHAFIREDEAVSVVMRESDAISAGLAVLYRCAWITLTVHSDLEAVGLTAAFASALGAAGISCNVVAGACHDHLFVPVEQGDQAMQALRALQARS